MVKVRGVLSLCAFVIDDCRGRRSLAALADTCWVD